MFINYTPNFVDEITFGVEIECYIPRKVSRADVFTKAGIRNRGGSSYKYWTTHSDCSLSTYGGSRDSPFYGTEFVSPVLSGKEGLAEVSRMLNAIKAVGGKVDTTCGLHVHTGYRPYFTEWKPLRRSVKNKLINNLIDWATEFDQSFMLIIARNRWTENYCNRFEDYCERDAPNLKRSYRKKFSDVENTVRGASHGANVNFTGFLYEDYKPTIEIRMLEGTLDADKVEAWIWLCQKFIHKAFTAENKWATRTHSFNEFIRFLEANNDRCAVRDEDTKRYVNTLRRIARKNSTEEFPYAQAHCNFASYIRPKRTRKIKAA
ncbi:MAG: amidoligase family protein [Candidatus Omnitrophica bacterium]|nr:amidoligase family protein [Candidatus Omnitrophota bacterium]